MEVPVLFMQVDESLDSDRDISFISIVTDPAFKRDFIAFSEDKIQFKVDTERRILSGPALLADTPVRRYTNPANCYLQIDKENVMKAAQKFFKRGNQANVNLFHDAAPGGVYVFESFITDKSRGIMPMKGYEDAKDGSWFISMKVDNDEVWDKVKAGELKGFSIEGFLNIVKMEDEKSADEITLEKIKSLLEMAHTQ
jgi:hypothetical protein